MQGRRVRCESAGAGLVHCSLFALHFTNSPAGLVLYSQQNGDYISV